MAKTEWRMRVWGMVVAVLLLLGSPARATDQFSAVPENALLVQRLKTTPFTGDNVSLLRYVDRVVDELRVQMDQRFAQSEKALERTAAQMEKRLDGMNEFRDALKDQNARFPDKKEVDLLAASLEKRISLIESWQANWQGKMWGLGLVITVFATLLNLALRRFIWWNGERK